MRACLVSRLFSVVPSIEKAQEDNALRHQQKAALATAIRRYGVACAHCACLRFGLLWTEPAREEAVQLHLRYLLRKVPTKHLTRMQKCDTWCVPFAPLASDRVRPYRRPPTMYLTDKTRANVKYKMALKKPIDHFRMSPILLAIPTFFRPCSFRF